MRQRECSKDVATRRPQTERPLANRSRRVDSSWARHRLLKASDHTRQGLHWGYKSNKAELFATCSPVTPRPRTRLQANKKSLDVNVISARVVEPHQPCSTAGSALVPSQQVLVFA